MRKSAKLLGFAVSICAMSAYAGAEYSGVKWWRGAIAGAIWGIFLIVSYVSIRFFRARSARLLSSGLAGFVCALVCALLLGRNSGEVAVWGIGGIVVGGLAELWLPYYQS